MASSYEEELYYSEEIVTKVHVYVPYIWVTVYDCTLQLCISICHYSSLPNKRPFL